MVRNVLGLLESCSQSAEGQPVLACERLSLLKMFFFNLCFTQCSKLIGILVCKKENMLENQEQNTETCWAVQPKYDSFALRKSLRLISHSRSLHSHILTHIVLLSLSETITSAILLHSLALQHNWNFNLRSSCRGIKELFIFISVMLISDVLSLAHVFLLCLHMRAGTDEDRYLC